jgi:beta-lactamase regulating signal transducer with metallopeptidase domain
MSPLAAVLIEETCKVGVIAGMGALAAAVLRRASAAVRYQVWMAIAGAMLLTPVVASLAPGWSLPAWEAAAPVPPARGGADGEVSGRLDPGGWALVEGPSAPATRGIDPALVLLACWLAGAAIQLIRLVAEMRFWRRILRRTIRADEEVRHRLGEIAGRVRFGYSEAVAVPVLVGWWRPAILMPPAAEDWPEATFRAVVLHEVAHYRRGDHWRQCLPAALRVIWWWHPAAWVTIRQLRIEREAACDDAVMGTGMKASDYAQALMRVVREAQGRRVWTGIAVAMASGARVSARVEAVLASNRRRGPVSRMARGVIGAGALGLAGAVGAAHSTVPEPATAASPSAEPASTPGAVPADETNEIEVIEVAPRFLEVSDDDYRTNQERFDQWVHAGDIVPFEKFSSVDLISAPRVTLRSGQESRVEIAREFRYPVAFERVKGMPITPTRFQTEMLGLAFDFTAERVGERVQVHGVATMRVFEGFTDGDEGVRVPTFLTKEVNIFRMIPGGGMVGFWLPGMSVRGIQHAGGDPAAASPSDSKNASRMAIFIEASIRKIPRPPDSTPAPAADSPTPGATASPSPPGTPVVSPAAKAAPSLPYGMPVAGKPGFLTSPFAPDQGMVDVRGFAPNTEVKCPYTGRVFLVP